MIGFSSGHRKGQALVELAAWGGLMLIGASILVSYMMNLIYVQDTMMRNFRMAVNFARQIGAKNTNATVIHELIVHKRIPSLPFLPDSGYKEFRHISQVRFTRNMFATEKDSDPDYPLTMVRIVMDGRILAEEMKIGENRFSHIHKYWLPDALERETALLNQVFFTDLPILDMIDASLEGIIDGAEKIRDKPKDFISWGDCRDYSRAKTKIKKYAEDIIGKDGKTKKCKAFLATLEGSYRDQNEEVKEEVKSCLKSVYGAVSKLVNSECFYDKKEVFTRFADEIGDELFLLENGYWKGDVAEDYWGKTTIESMKGEIRIEQDNSGGRISVINPYSQRRTIRSSYGNNEIEWLAPDEEISW